MKPDKIEIFIEVVFQETAEDRVEFQITSRRLMKFLRYVNFIHQNHDETKTLEENVRVCLGLIIPSPESKNKYGTKRI